MPNLPPALMTFGRLAWDAANALTVQIQKDGFPLNVFSDPVIAVGREIKSKIGADGMGVADPTLFALIGRNLEGLKRGLPDKTAEGAAFRDPDLIGNVKDKAVAARNAALTTINAALSAGPAAQAELSLMKPPVPPKGSGGGSGGGGSGGGGSGGGGSGGGGSGGGGSGGGGSGGGGSGGGGSGGGGSGGGGAPPPNPPGETPAKSSMSLGKIIIIGVLAYAAGKAAKLF